MSEMVDNINEDSSQKRNTEDSFLVGLLTANHYRIYNFILSLVVNQTDADDIMQETSMVLWEKRNSFEHGTDFIAWALTIAKYQVLSHRKKKKLTVSFDDDVMNALDEKLISRIDNSDARIEALSRCVNMLNSDSRKLIQLRYQKKGGAKAIAKRSGLSLYQIYRKLSRINGILMRCIRKRLQAEGVL